MTDSNAIISNLAKGNLMKASTTNIKVGDGNLVASIKSNNVNLNAGIGNQIISVEGNDVNISIDNNADLDFNIATDFDTIAVKGNNVNIDTGDGNDTALVLGSNVNIDMGVGNHITTFYGDNVKINLGNTLDLENGYNIAMSADRALDSANINGSALINKNTTVNGLNIGAAFAEAVQADYIDSKDISVITTQSGTSKAEFLENMKKTYNLDDANMKELERLYDADALKGGYAVLKSVQQKNPDGSDKYVLAKIDADSGVGNYIHAWGFRNGSYNECLATNQSGIKTVQQITTTTTTERDLSTIYGKRNLEINFGDSGSTLIDATAQGRVNIDGGDAAKGFKINVNNFIEKVIAERVNVSHKTDTVTLRTNIAGTFTSPLVVDFDGDGKVEAASTADGVDVNNDGIADGAATGGDKMLAMTDVNGNGRIDGNEVFGNNTVSPFTGKPLNAANGFEALKMVALEAEARGYDCMENGKVNLRALQVALNSVGVNLGFISDDNVTELEGLGHIASITVDEYEEVEATGDVQHRQLGSATTVNGETVKTNDVWFKNRT